MTDDELTGSSTTFDLVAAIEGRTYPELDVRVYFDETAANAIGALNAELTRLAALGRTEEYGALEPVFDQAITDLKDSEFTFTLRSVPRKVKKAWLAKAQAKFPDKKPDKNGNQEPNFDGFQYVELLQWQSYIVKITDPTGHVNSGPFAESLIQKLMDEAPEASLQAISAGIEELDNGSKAGYETAVRNLDFLSSASHEASADDTPPPSE